VSIGAWHEQQASQNGILARPQQGNLTPSPAHMTSSMYSKTINHSPTYNIDSGLGTEQAIEWSKRRDEARLTSL